MEQWKEYRLGDLCTISSSKRIFAKEYVNEGIPFYRGKEIIQLHKGEEISDHLYISKVRYSEIRNKYGVPKVGDILLTSVGTLGIPYIIKHSDFYFKDGNLTWFYNFKNIRNTYLYYWFCSKYGKSQIDKIAIGSTQKALTINSLSEILIQIPPFKVQDKIVEILKSLDSKIDLNRKINSNLEEQAKALFKSWFIDFEPFKGGKFVDSELGKIPEGWKVLSLDDIADYLNGLAMQKYRPATGEQTLPVLKIKELGQGYCDASCDKCSSKVPSQYIVNDGDVIFSWSGTLMVDLWCGGICGLNQHLFKVSSEDYPKWFYLMWTLEHLNRFIHIAKDKAVTMGHIKREELHKAKVVVPTTPIFNKANMLFAPIVDKMINTRISNRKLAAVRNALLPKLMSGEIDV